MVSDKIYFVIILLIIFEPSAILARRVSTLHSTNSYSKTKRVETIAFYPLLNLSLFCVFPVSREDEGQDPARELKAPH